ncbi:MAG: outer membrane protein assembly factor BamE [Zetaproteobacteria bacterium]|nr:outer membrane protein assembly factor BamE [Zetaproteobacteria bacterium]
MRNILMALACAGVAMATTACMKHPMHQGNVLDDQDAQVVHVGDSQFRVETILGSPAIIDSLNPRHVFYIEDVYKPETKVHYKRHIEIYYTPTLLVDRVNLQGFDTPRNEEVEHKAE